MFAHLNTSLRGLSLGGRCGELPKKLSVDSVLTDSMMMININLKHWLYMESIYDDDHVWHLPSVIRFLACDCRLRWVARWIRDHDLQVGITILLSLFYLDGDHLRISTYLCFFSLNGDLLIGRLNRLESGWNTMTWTSSQIQIDLQTFSSLYRSRRERETLSSAAAQAVSRREASTNSTNKVSHPRFKILV